MNELTPVTAWLKERTPEELAELIGTRPRLLEYGPVPRSLPELARLLTSDYAMAEVLREVDLPEYELLSAAARLVAADQDGTHRYEMRATRQVPVGQLLAAVDPAHRQAARHVLDRLLSRLLLLPSGADDVGLPGAVQTMLGRNRRREPRTLDRALASSFNKDEVLRIAQVHGITSMTRLDAQKRLVALFADPAWVRKLVGDGPPEARELLEKLISTDAVLAARCFDNYTGRYVFAPAGSSPPGVEWLALRGLLVPYAVAQAEVPLEVVQAFVDDRHDPFTPEPPLPPTRPVPLERARGEAQAAASAAVGRLEQLLKALAAAPAMVRKSGGLAVRETRRLAKVIGAGEDETRLWIDLCSAAGLAGVETTKVGRKEFESRLLPTAAYDPWLAGSAADRLVPVLKAWLGLHDIVTWWPDNEETPVALPGAHDQAAPVLRHSLLRVLAVLPEGTGALGEPGPLVAATAWFRPLAMEYHAGPKVLATLREAELLGVAALGSLTPLGHALLADGDLDTAVRELLPAPQTHAHFQADLTAVVTGSPAPELATLLNSCADRESEGHAVVWRLGPSSIRRALDAGLDAATLVAELAAAAHGSLPQPLEYLIKDTARKHGAVRVVKSACCLRSDDEALVAELAGHRALKKLGLRRIAPTVLISAKPVAATLEALRSAGYAPALEAETGATVVERAAEHRAPKVAPTRRSRQAPAALDVARSLLSG